MKPVFAGLPLAAKGETWDVPADFDVELADGFPTIDRQAEYQRSKLWLIANPTKRKTGKGMHRFLLNWFTTVQNRGTSAPGQRTAPLPFAVLTEEGRKERHIQAQIDRLRDEQRPRPKPIDPRQEQREMLAARAAAGGVK